MSQVENMVLSVVQDFINNSVLFTALDVSNKVKETMPQVRHREIRDVVRVLFSSTIEPAGYARTPILVNLSDGVSQAEALLYHPLSDSWDLDRKYDDQCRSQVSVKNATPTLPSISNNGTTASVGSDGTVIVNNITTANTPVNTTPAMNPVQSAWKTLFDSQISLFPRKS